MKHQFQASNEFARLVADDHRSFSREKQQDEEQMEKPAKRADVTTLERFKQACAARGWHVR